MRRAGIALVAAVGGGLLVPAVPLAEDVPAGPVAALEAGSGTAVAGSPVRLDSSRSTGTIVDRRWDLDGNGSFETDGGASPTAETTPAAPGPLTVRVQVVDADGRTGDASLDVTVQAEPARAPAPAPDTAARKKAPAPSATHPNTAAAKRRAPAVRAAAAGGVSIKNFSFSPGQVSVHVGDSVTWTNGDSAPHTATASDGSFDTGILKKGASGSHTFTKAGTISYICSVHPNMKGTVVVVAAASSPGSGSSRGGSGAAATPAPTPTTTPAGTAGTLPQTGVNLLAVAGIAALLMGSGALLRRRVAR